MLNFEPKQIQRAALFGALEFFGIKGPLYLGHLNFLATTLDRYDIILTNYKSQLIETNIVKESRHQQ
jgi:hypothetical protein